MRFRYIFCFLIIFFASDLFSQTSWNWQNPSPQGNDLRCVIVKADSFGIAVGDVGTTLRRAKGIFGNSTYPTTKNLNCICYYNDTIWIGGNNGEIYRSLDNGDSWSSQSYTSKSKVNFHSCFDKNKTDLWIAGDSGIILYSTNSGVAWTKQTNSNKNNLNCITNGGKKNVYAVGDGGTILQALNFGASGFFAITNSHKFSFHAVAMDTAQAFIVGDSSYILHRDVVADALIADTILNNGANNFYDVAYANPYVIVIGSNGAIRRSTDNGDTWSSSASGATEKLFKIALSGDFAATGIAWVVGEGGVFLRTANYGSTWSRLDTGVRGTVYAAALSPNGDMYATSIVGKSYRLLNNGTKWKLDSLKAGGAPRLLDITFDKNGFGLIATYDINVLKSADSGRNWQSINVNSSGVQTLGVANWASVGLASASNGVIYRTTTKGGGWAATTTNNTQALYDVDMSGTSAIAVGSNGTVLYSTNSGLAWTKPVSSGATAQLIKVRFASATNAVAVSNTGVIIRTTDKGVTWSAITSGVSTSLNDIAFHDDKNGIITGDGGLILKTNDGGKTWTKDQSNTLADLKGVIIKDGATAFVVGSKMAVLSTSNSALPVELMNFMGKRLSSNRVLLDWSVANEHDNFGYAVERNFGDDWQQVGFRNGIGTTSTQQNYSLADLSASKDQLNYRLRQIDLDGSEHLIGSVAIAPEVFAEDGKISIYPNPVLSDARVEFTISSVRSVRIALVNDFGVELSVLTNTQYQIGSHSLTVNTRQISSGTYHLIFTTPTQKIVKEFVVVK